jgi:hypothetical protein
MDVVEFYRQIMDWLFNYASWRVSLISYLRFLIWSWIWHKPLDIFFIIFVFYFSQFKLFRLIVIKAITAIINNR